MARLFHEFDNSSKREYLMKVGERFLLHLLLFPIFSICHEPLARSIATTTGAFVTRRKTAVARVPNLPATKNLLKGQKMISNEPLMLSHSFSWNGCSINCVEPSAEAK